MRPLLFVALTAAFLGSTVFLAKSPAPATSPYSGLPVATIGDVFRHH